MIPLTARQREVGRRQLAMERDLIARGMDPLEAQEAAGRGIFMTEQARDGLAAANAPLDAGNGADLDSLDGAAAPLSVESELGGPAGRIAPPQSERVYRDDPTMGMAGMLAAREAAQAMRDSERAAMYDQRTQAYVDEYGMIGTPGAAPLTQDQRDAREALKLREAEARHTPYQEDARIARLAERAGMPVEQAAAMVQAGYNDYAKQKNAQPWTVAGVNNTTERPDFAQMAYAHRALRQAGDTQRQAELAERQQAVVRRRMAQTNPLEYMNRDDISDWNRMIVANQLLGPRGYRGATPLDVDQAREQAKAAIQGRLAMAPHSDDTAALELRREMAAEDRMRAGRKEASAVFSYWDKDPEVRRRGAIELLQKAGYSQAEINIIINDMFPPASATPTPARPSAGAPASKYATGPSGPF